MKAEIQRALELMRSDNSGSLEQAIGLLQNTVFSFSMKVCGHREDAEDTMQETLLRAAPQLPRFESPEALAVWLYKVARSRCLMSRRKSKFAPQQKLSLDELLPDRAELEAVTAAPEVTPEQQLLRREDRRELQAAVLRVPPQYRQILVLHDMEELSTSEIAQITGLRAGTVRVRLHRARVFLRNELARQPQRARRRARRPQRPSRECRKLFAALSDYLDEELDAADCEQLEGHLEDCSPCQAFLASLEETVRRCRRHCGPQVRSKLAEQVRAELLRMYQQALSRKTTPAAIS